jgi:hypothetical protein
VKRAAGFFALAACLAPAHAARGQASLAEVDALQVAKGARPTSAAAVDLDGDGKREVLIATRGRGKDSSRSLQIWRRGATAYAMADELPLTRDVVAWATGDVLDAPGSEIVLFNASGAFAWRSSGPPEQRLQRLCAVEFLWQLADPDEVLLLPDCVRDVDGDGLADLVLPEPDGYRIVVQRRPRAADGPWGIESRLSVPPECNEEGLWMSASATEGPNLRGKRDDQQFSLAISSGGDSSTEERVGPHTLLQINEGVPSPHWIDWDGDGDLDLLAQTSQSLLVWKQDHGHWPAAPSVTLKLPVAADRARRLDASYSSHAVDLDGDSRADCVVFAGDARSEDVRTQGLFFTQAAAGAEHPLFGAEGRPRDVLVFAGFVTNPTFVDVDGDGLSDLVLRSVRPDLIDQLRSAANKAIEADLFVYLNRKGSFPRQPDLVWHHAIPIERFELTSEFIGDLSGDGVRDLLVRDEPKHLRALLVRRGSAKGGGWSVVDQPLWQLDVDEDANVSRVDVKPNERPQLLVIEPTQVLHVRFR